VDDFFADVDGRTEGLKRYTNDVDGAYHAGAEAAWLQQKESLVIICHYEP